jgi:hypothetical protein
MVILITLATVNLVDSLARGRDTERETDVQNIIMFQEGMYTRNSGSYFPTPATRTGYAGFYTNIDVNNLRAPGYTGTTTDSSLVAATNTVQTTSGVTPQPTLTTYVYQPLTSSGTLCTSAAPPWICRKFNIYYLRESDSTVVMLSSKNQ